MSTNYQLLGSFTLGATGASDNSEVVDMDRFDIGDMQLFVTVAFASSSGITGVSMILQEAASPVVEGNDEGKWYKVGGFTAPATAKYDPVGEIKTLNTVAVSQAVFQSIVSKVDIVENAVGRCLRAKFTNNDPEYTATVTLEAYI